MKVFFLAIASTGKPGMPSFQEDDVRLLRDLGHDVRILVWHGREYSELIRGARSADVVFGWHIGRHTWLASWLGRPLACVVGGYEFANLPECDYGSMRSARTRWMTKRVWKRANALLYVDPSLEDEATKAFGHPGHAFYVPTGYDTEFWTPDAAERENIAVTVCHAPTQERILLKGVDLFFAAAKANPEIEFHIAGELPPQLKTSQFGSNVVADGWLDREGLRRLYRRARVYCQFSLHEGLPNAVCEAMLCGCVPVGTRTNGIPNAIDDAGFLVERDVISINEGIRGALNRDDLRGRARDHITRTFPVERRKRELKEILEKLVASN